jgi:hypothetical protein
MQRLNGEGRRSLSRQKQEEDALFPHLSSPSHTFPSLLPQVLCINEAVRSGGPAALLNERCLDLQQRKPSTSRKAPKPGQQQQQHQQQAGSAPSTAAAAGAPMQGARSKGRSKQQASHGCPHLTSRGPAWDEFVDDVLGHPLDVEVRTD